MTTAAKRFFFPRTRNDCVFSRNRSAFTLIELIAVLSIITILGMMSVPAALAATRRGALNQTVVAIERVCQHAQAEARRGRSPINPATSPHFGVMIVQQGAERYIALLRGTSINDAAIDAVGVIPVLRLPIPLSAEVLTATGGGVPVVLNGRIGWYYRFVDGAPISGPADQRAIGVGTSARVASPGERTTTSDSWNIALPLPALPASPVCTELILRAKGSQGGTSISIYPNGLLATFTEGTP